MTIWSRREMQPVQEFRGQLLPARGFVAHRVNDLVCNARTKPMRGKCHHQWGWDQRRGLKVAPQRQFRGRVGNQEIGDTQCGSDAFRQNFDAVPKFGIREKIEAPLICTRATTEPFDARIFEIHLFRALSSDCDSEGLTRVQYRIARVRHEYE